MGPDAFFKQAHFGNIWQKKKFSPILPDMKNCLTFSLGVYIQNKEQFNGRLRESSMSTTVRTTECPEFSNAVEKSSWIYFIVDVFPRH